MDDNIFCNAFPAPSPSEMGVGVGAGEVACYNFPLEPFIEDRDVESAMLV